MIGILLGSSLHADEFSRLAMRFADQESGASVLQSSQASPASTPLATNAAWVTSSQTRFLPRASEPFGAEDFGAQDNRPLIPEPMVFDLVRPLGAHKGEFEINCLGEFPLQRGGNDEPDDPLGLTPSSVDRNEIEWAPEIEYAPLDGFAVEFELPFEGSSLEAYKFAAQWTIHTAFEDHFIDGAQLIVEPNVEFEAWDITAIYIAGYQFNERWSVLGMAGDRTW